MHRLETGALLNISEPRNHFGLVPAATHSILLAGGIGVTPILCMAETLAAQCASFEVHYGARTRRRAAFLDRLAQAGLARNTACYFAEDEPGGQIDFPAILARPDSGTHVYVCGPGGFIQAAFDAAHAAGWSGSSLHREFFAATAMRQPQRCDAFKVRIASSGRLIDVDASQSVASALLAAGIDLPMSCEQGVCGTCLTRVIEGEPEHLDSYLTDDERAANDRFLPCCSRSRSAVLVLDL